MYQDQIKKIAYYRARIIKELIRKGIYPEDSLISARISEIDTMLAIYQYSPVSRNEAFDAAKVNEDFVRVYEDLKILYQIAYDISVKQFEELQLYCETHIAELQNMANKYQYKTQFELNATYMGDTVFYQSVGYNVTENNGVITVDLGKIELEQQSKLSCIFDCDTVEQKDVIFVFEDSDGKIHNCSPYDYNKDFFTVPGKLKCDKYIFSHGSGRIATGFICTPSELKGQISHNHKYMLYGGKGYLTVGYYNKRYIYKQPGVPVGLEAGGICTFWILDGTYAKFEFSAMPDNKNFEGTEISALNNHHKITIEHSEQLEFDFQTDGIIYATHQKGTILNKELYYPTNDQLEEILVEDYSVGDKDKYKVSVIAGPFINGEIPVIKSIAIKQLSMLEEA